MSISSLSGSSAAGTASANGSGTTSAADQQDRFMTLLVAQMKNQDPLNPMDNAQMTSQIAQINTVAGLEKLNKTVEGLMSGFAAMQVQSASLLPGRSVLVPGTTVQLDDGVARGGIELAGPADSVQVDILAADGQVLQTLQGGSSPAGVRSFAWDGSTAAGDEAAAGAYRVRITASKGGQPVTATALSAVRVQAMVPSATGVMLDLGSAGLQPLADVRSFL